MPPQSLELVDLFCGAGGMTLGLRNAGITPRLGVDMNPHCIATYRRNFPNASSRVGDVTSLRSSDLLGFVRSRDSLVLAGCPPCQIFSQLHRSKRRTSKEFQAYLRLLWSVMPAFLVFENVPRILRWSHLWDEFCDRLRRRGYSTWSSVVCATSFGVPQTRRRLVVIASRLVEVAHLNLPQPRSVRTVRWAIGKYPEEQAGIPNHRSMNLSSENQARIRQTPKDGGLSKPETDAFSDSYGRMHWDRPAPTITTKCISFSNGRFGHPWYDRAITVREAAALQGFPGWFVFEGPLKESARQVGNAAPPPLGAWIGRQLANLLREER